MTASAHTGSKAPPFQGDQVITALAVAPLPEGTGKARLHMNMLPASFLHPVVEFAYRLVSYHFLFLWLLALAAIVLGGVYVSDRQKLPVLTPGDLGASPKASSTLSTVDWICGLALAVFVACYILAILHKEDFCYYDDDMLTESTLRGMNFPLPIWPALGRFYPLGEQEFNLLRYVTRSPAGYHSIAVVELVILLVALFFVLSNLRSVYRVPILVAAMLSPGFLIAFTGLTYPERNVLFWLGILLLCLVRHSKTKGRIYFVGCLVAAHFALYYKETVVLILVPYAAARIFFELYNDPRGVHRPWRELASENSLPLGILAVAGIYAGMLAAVMLPTRSLSYVDSLRATPGAALLGYLHTNWLPFLLIAVLILRLGGFVFRKESLDPLWDSLAVGAAACFFCLVGLGLYAAYYAAPVDLIALVYLAQVSRGWLSKPTRLRLAAVTAGFLCLVLHDAAYSSFRLIERKGVISLRSQLADFVKSYHPTGDSGAIELFFPYASGKHLMELSVYLNYKGFPVAGQTGKGNSKGPAAIFEAPQEFPHGRCIDYRDYACMHAGSPPEGSLIVVLPDDHVSRQDVAQNLGAGSALLFESQACGFCTREHSWVEVFHTISPGFWNSPLPDRWLQLQIFKKTSPASASYLERRGSVRPAGKHVPPFSSKS